MASTQFSWLIEAPGPHWLKTITIGRQARFAWTRNANEALRFMNKAHAEGVCYSLQKLEPDLFAFSLTLGDPKITEHGFLEAATADVE